METKLDNWRAALLAALILCGAFCWPTNAAFAQPLNHEHAGPQDALNFVSTLATSAQDIFLDEALSPAEQEAQIRDLFKRSFNTRYIALFALGPYRRELPSTELQSYQTLFTDYIFAKYVDLIEAQTHSTTTTIHAQPVGPRDAIVHMMIEQTDGAQIDTEWRVRIFDGEPHIIDVAIGGLSLTQDQRREFTTLIKKSGVTGLMTVLENGAAQAAERT